MSSKTNSKPTNKGGHGKQHPMNLGNPEVGYLGGMAGRIRKKQRHHNKPAAQVVAAMAPPKDASGFRLQVAGEVIALIDLSYEPKYAGASEKEYEVRVRVKWSNCGLSTNVFLPLWQVEKHNPSSFQPNVKLPPSVQEEQRELHVFLYHTLDQLKEFKQCFEEESKKELAEQKVNAFYEYADYAANPKTCSDIRELVLGREKVYRIADTNGKWAVFLARKWMGEISITLKYYDQGHELEGKAHLGTFVKLEDLKYSNLFGHKVPNDAREVHAFLRSRAMTAGVKLQQGAALNRFRLQQLEQKFSHAS